MKAAQDELEQMGPKKYNAFKHVTKEEVGDHSVLDSTWQFVWKKHNGVVFKAKGRLCMMGEPKCRRS